MRPLILLDIDGVLNPCDAKPTRRPVGYTTIRVRPSGWERAKNPLRVWLNPDHGRLLLEFAAEHDAELVWATTWMADANKFISPVIGLPELPYVDYLDHPGTIKGWKYPATLTYAVGRPLVWLDDDFGDLARIQHRDDFMEKRKAAGLATKLHHVDSRIGLTELDLTQVGRWLRSLSG